jgi:hypothetical protein
METILDYTAKMQEFLLEIQMQDHSFPAEPNISCKLDPQSRITQSPRKITKKKKKHILPPCPPQTLEPKKTDQTQHFPTPMDQLLKHEETLLPSSGRQNS